MSHCLSDAHIYPVSVPEQIGFTTPILNPGLPPAKAHTLVSPFTPPHGPVISTTRGIGPQRTYYIVQNLSQDRDTVAYPPRPISGSIADFDIILEHCNFVNGKVSHAFFFPFQGRNLKAVSLSAIVLNFCALALAWTTGGEYVGEIWTRPSIFTRRKNLAQKIYIFSKLLFL